MADERNILEHHAPELAASRSDAELLPRVVLVPGLGAFTAGRTARDAAVARDITAQAIEVKAAIGASGAATRVSPTSTWWPCSIAACSTRSWAGGAPHPSPLPARRSIAVVTGAAGAIGSGVCRVLLEAGAAWR